ncbi:MAG: hypothetical protein KDJ80_12365 [Nitratireductor sp.]|nr:hypothetical protein [Nitratireductor sp.]
MPQLIALGLVGALVWYAWRELKRHMHKVDAELRQREAERDRSGNIRDIAPLEKGEDGVYRPRRED